MRLDENGNEYILVHWDGHDDQEHTLNMPLAYRLYLIILSALLTLCTALASSAPSMLFEPMMMEFGTTLNVIKATVFLYVASFAVGPLLWAPLSERIGERPVFILSFALFFAFNIGCMFAPNVAAMMVLRILSGACGSSSLTNSASLIAQVTPLKHLTSGMALFALAPVGGPCIGPIMAGYILNSNVNWRWVFRVVTIFSFVLWLLVIFTMAETNGDVRLKYKAARLRRTTGDERYRAPMEMRKTSVSGLLKATLLKPVLMSVKEPMLMAVTLYVSFVYAVVYLLFEAFPIVFGLLHRFRPGAVGLTFLSFLTGCILGILYAVLVDQKLYNRRMRRGGLHRLPPESRLWPTIIGGPIFAGALFWFAWTSYPSVNFWAPLVAGVGIGLGVFMIFFTLIMYIAEVYAAHLASAMAVNTVVRSCFGAGFPMFGQQMYEQLNPRWASTVLAFIAVAMIPIPWVLYRFGAKLRSMASYAQG